MKGVIIEKQGGEPLVTNELERPKPGTDQVLVKSLYVAMNPVDSFVANTGILLMGWPMVVGVDASGVVVEAGEEAQSKYKLRPGMYVCGCTRIGIKEYAAGQEYHLMDAQVALPKPENITTLQAATIGAGIETAALSIFEGLNVDLPNPEHVNQKDEWVVVLGGASSVGWYAVQLLQAAGFKVLTSCSKKSSDALTTLGVQTFDYKTSTEDQLKVILDVTGGNFSRVFDGAAADDPVLVRELFKHDLLQSKSKYFATTNDWSSIDDFEGGKTYCVALGPLGRPEAAKLNSLLEMYIPVLVKLIENGSVKVGDYELIGDGGVEGIVEAYKYKAGGTSGLRKVVVKVQDE